jgi:hypothetical protein
MLESCWSALLEPYGRRIAERQGKEKHMQTTLDRPTTSPATVSEADAQRVASQWVAASIDPIFAVVSGARVQRPSPGREVWQFVIRCEHGPLDAIEVDAQTGEVLPLPDDMIRVIREKAAIYAARKRGIVPVNEHGYVLGEYARRQGDSYLSMEVSLFYSATEGVFVPLACPLWQFLIQVRLPRLGVLGKLGTLDVDARTGEVIPLTHKQIKQIRERADALVEFRTQTAAA